MRSFIMSIRELMKRESEWTNRHIPIVWQWVLGLLVSGIIFSIGLQIMKGIK